MKPGSLKANKFSLSLIVDASIRRFSRLKRLSPGVLAPANCDKASRSSQGGIVTLHGGSIVPF
jgi:hypothetical protein